MEGRMTSDLVRDTSAALTPGKQPQVPIGEESGWAPEPVLGKWREKPYSYRDSHSDNSAVAGRYTECAIPDLFTVYIHITFSFISSCSLADVKNIKIFHYIKTENTTQNINNITTCNSLLENDYYDEPFITYADK
jgi:hypothetical protein